MSRSLFAVALLLLTAGAVPPATNPAAAEKATEIAIDDGASAGKKSIAGSGHAVVLPTPARPDPGRPAALTAVKIFGSRYGMPQPPKEDFHVWLCDADGEQIKEFKFPYKLFARGEERWVTLKLPEPAELPTKGNFILCVGFNPERTRGVYVHYDQAVDGDNRTGLPGDLSTKFTQGDWLIRAVVTVK